MKGQRRLQEAPTPECSVCCPAWQSMLQAKKEALENSIRQRLVAVRERELNYYFDNCRIMGTTSAVLSGLAMSGIQYHYLLVRSTDWDDTYELAQHSIEEMVFLAILTITLGLNLQLLFICMLVSLLGPQLALRGPDGSLHDAVEGMHSWNTVIMAFFMLSVFLLELCVFSFSYGHKQLNDFGRVILVCTDSLLIFATVRYARKIMRRLALPKEQRVSGAFFAHQKGDPISSFQGLEHEGFRDDPVHANGLSSARIPTRAAPSATRIAGDEALPLTAESLDHSVNEFLSGHALASIPVHRPLEAPAPEPPGPSAASCVAAAGWGVFPSVKEPRGHESEEEDEEMPLNGRPRNLPAVRISKKPRRAQRSQMLNPSWLNLGAPPTEEHEAPAVSWREELRLLRHALFVPPHIEKSLQARDGFGRQELERVKEQEEAVEQLMREKAGHCPAGPVQISAARTKNAI